MGVLLLVLLLLSGIQCRALSWPSRFHTSKQAKVSLSGAALRAGRLLPPVPDGTIGSFLDRNQQDQSIIQCNILALSDIDGTEYGVGYPVDMPVMLTYFEGSELKPVRPDYPDYDHLVNHVAVQLEGNDLHLFQTPIVLTLQGNFEDEEFNEVDPFQRSQHGRSGSAGSGDEDSDSEEGDEEDAGEEMEYDESAQEITLEELLRTEDFDNDIDDDGDGDEDRYGDQDDEDGWAEEDSSDATGSANHDNFRNVQDGELQSGGSERDPLLAFLNPVGRGNRQQTPVTSYTGNSATGGSSPTGSKPAAAQDIADFKLHRPTQPDLSDISSDVLVTPEDTAGLQRAHRRADRIIEYATDMRLMGSFHYKKRNFHLVRLLEPIFVMGKRLADIKGHFFALLDELETEQVRPVLEELLLRSQPTTSHSDGFGTSTSATAERALSDDTRGSAGTSRRYGAKASAGRDPSHKGFGDNRRGCSADGEDPQRTNQRTAGSAGETRDVGSGNREAGGMGGKVTQFAHPAAATKRRPSEAGESQYQSAKRKWQQVRKQQP